MGELLLPAFSWLLRGRAVGARLLDPDDVTLSLSFSFLFFTMEALISSCLSRLLCDMEGDVEGDEDVGALGSEEGLLDSIECVSECSVGSSVECCAVL